MSPVCHLAQVAYRHEALCEEAECPFWEPGGAVLAGRCGLEEIDFGGRSDLAEELLRIKNELQELHAVDREAQLAHLYHRLLNTSDDV